jgi:hypothetical protein
MREAGPDRWFESALKRPRSGNREYTPVGTLRSTGKSAQSKDHACCAGTKGKSRAQFRDDYPDKNEQFAKVNTMIAKAETAQCKFAGPVPKCRIISNG